MDALPWLCSCFWGLFVAVKEDGSVVAWGTGPEAPDGCPSLVSHCCPVCPDSQCRVCLEQFVAVQCWAASALLLDGFQCCVWFFFRRRRSALDDPDGISINLGFIFRALLPFSGIMKMADFLKRAMVDSFAVGEVFTLAWAHAEAHSYYRLICSCPGLSARGFFGYLEVAPALIACCKRSLLSLDRPSRDSVFLPVPLNAFNATSIAYGSFSGVVVCSVPSLSGRHRSWNEHGNCRYGELCRFAHGLEELRNNKLNEDQTSSATSTLGSTEVSLAQTSQSISISSTMSEQHACTVLAQCRRHSQKGPSMQCLKRGSQCA